MKRPTFMDGATLALLLATGSAAVYFTFAPVFGNAPMLKLIIAAVAGLYVVYLLGRSGEKTGRVTVAVAWLLGAAVTDAFVPGLLLFSAAHLGMIWLIRSLYFHTSWLGALIDMSLCGAGLLAAVAAAKHSHSVFLCVWTFFLIQALFGAIPSIRPQQPSEHRGEDQFNRARRGAEAALRRIHTNH